jgi:hypothetical protein
MGLSEETDAVVVVVSEETGAVSYAYRGQLVRGVTLEELRAFLTSVLVTPAERSRNWFGLARFWRRENAASGPVALANTTSPSTVAAGTTTATTTTMAK